MTKPQPLVIDSLKNSMLCESGAHIPQTPDEKVAASALLTLLTSPSLAKPSEPSSSTWGKPALKRQKSDQNLKRRVLTSQNVAKEVQPPPRPMSVAEQMANLSPEERDITAVVTRAMNGEPVEAEKIEEARRWLYHNVELVRGKYKGRTAAVVGMTAKKYRVRVDGVEHQLEVSHGPYCTAFGPCEGAA